MTNILLKLKAYNIKIYLLRHGPSLANRHQLIVSNLNTEDTIPAGLDPEFKEELAIKLRTQAKDYCLDNQTLIFSSPLKRTQETALILQNTINSNNPIISANLIERNFGDYEGTNDENYNKVWEQDQLSDSNNLAGVESVAQVLSRFLTFIASFCCEEYKDCKLVLISHGDPINILLAYIKNAKPGEHRNLENKHIVSGEMLALNS